jgi:uncharacterized protein (DUF58 family)
VSVPATRASTPQSPDPPGRQPGAGPEPSPWLLAGPYPACLVVGIVVLAMGVLARRPDVGVLGVPLLLMVAWTWFRRPTGPPEVQIAPGEQTPGSGRLTAEVRVGDQAAERPRNLIGFRVGAPGHRPVECLVPDRPATYQVRMRTVRTGRREVFWLEQRAASADRLWVIPPAEREPLELTVLPTTHPLALAPLPFRLAGLTGQHGSRRAGDGGDLHDVAPFAPGDRLRRIDWRVTARLNTGGPPIADRAAPPITTLYVRRTFATADATVMLVVDSRDEVGPRVVTWNDSAALGEREARSLDIARVAAASVARHYLNAGDRVGLEDLGRLRRPVPPAAGRRQLDRLVRRLALAQPAGEPTERKRVPRLPSGALIIVFSTLLDDDPARLASHWRRAGNRVIVVDVLPPLSTVDLNSRRLTAYRIVALERRDRIRRLAGNDVELVSWPSTADPVVPRSALTVLARQRRLPLGASR